MLSAKARALGATLLPRRPYRGLEVHCPDRKAAKAVRQWARECGLTSRGPWVAERRAERQERAVAWARATRKRLPLPPFRGIVIAVFGLSEGTGVQ